MCGPKKIALTVIERKEEFLSSYAIKSTCLAVDQAKDYF